MFIVKQEIIKRCYIHKKFAIILQKIQGDKLIMVVTVGKKKKMSTIDLD